MSEGIGSNDIGLDRNQLGQDRIVYFHRVGPKVLLIQPNYRYRANTNEPKEKVSVVDGFAKSTLWGFEVAVEENDRVLVDATDFFLTDAHGVVAKLKEQKMGDYKFVCTDANSVFKDCEIEYNDIGEEIQTYI